MTKLFNVVTVGEEGKNLKVNMGKKALFAYHFVVLFLTPYFVTGQREES